MSTSFIDMITSYPTIIWIHLYQIFYPKRDRIFKFIS